MNRMLINATQKEELRVALVDGQNLYDLDIEHTSHEQKKANIYKGKITRIEPSLEAAFVEYGSERHGFLPLKEVARDYLVAETHQDAERVSIKEVLKEGQELLIQVVKEERGSKGAALTTFISLAGCYLVLMPNNPRAGGISRRIEGNERNELREIINQLTVPEDMGVIVRTAGVGKSLDELQWDLNILLLHWSAIKKASTEHPAPILIHQEGDVVLRSIRDYLRRDISEILIDDYDIFIKARNFIQQVRPDFINRVKLYQDTIPLFTRFQIETQIETAYQREVRLPSGGFMVIDRSEALVAIDINSGRDTKGLDIEETALNTNLEAADEIARQLRLRDLGGLIVIDFIDMSPSRNQREVENRLREALKMDRARVQIGRISRFGLLEMSRQRLRPALGEFSQLSCPRCKGHGTIRSVESLALSLIRIIEESAMKPQTGQVQIQVPIDAATYLINEKRQAIIDIEKRHRVNVIIICNRHLETPEYKIERIKLEEIPVKQTSSYQLTQLSEEELKPRVIPQHEAIEPAVMSITQTASMMPEKESPGLIKRLWNTLFGNRLASSIKPEVSSTEKHQRHHSGEARDKDRQQHKRRDHRNMQNRDKTSSGSRNRSRMRRPNRDNKRRPHPAKKPEALTEATNDKPQINQETAPKETNS